MDPIDLDQFKADPTARRQGPKANRPPRHKGGEWFLKGPIPGAWLAEATKLSGRAVKTALALWYLAGMEKSRTVKPTWAVWKRLGLSPDAGRCGLAALERAGLISVDRHRGRCPRVMIEEVPDGVNIGE